MSASCDDAGFMSMIVRIISFDKNDDLLTQYVLCQAKPDGLEQRRGESSILCVDHICGSLNSFTDSSVFQLFFRCGKADSA